MSAFKGECETDISRWHATNYATMGGGGGAGGWGIERGRKGDCLEVDLDGALVLPSVI